MNFLEIEFPLAGRDSETIAAALEELGALSVTFMDRGDEPVLEPLPGEVRLWSDTAVTALFDDSLSAEQRLAQLARHVAADIAFHAQTRGVEDRVWEREWLKDWRPLQFGQWLWVYPTDCEEPVPDGAVVVHGCVGVHDRADSRPSPRVRAACSTSCPSTRTSTASA